MQLLQLAATLLGFSARRSARRLAGLTLTFAIALVFFAIGLLGFGAAAFIVLARATDPLIAALLLGSGSCLIGAILLLIARSRATAAHLLFESPSQQADAQALSQVASAATLWGPLILALLAGFLLTSKKD